MRALKGAAFFIWGIAALAIVAGILIGTGLSDRMMRAILPPTGTPAPTSSPLPSATPSPTSTPTITRTPTATATPTVAPTFTETATETPSPTASPLPFASGPIVIGTSVDGRPIEAYRFGTGPIERLTIHGIHGGAEYNTIELADQFIAELTVHPERIPQNLTLYIVRDLNPDGEAHSHDIYGRTNADGVDLNRNWNAYWKPVWNLSGCWQYTKVTGGTYPFSEPETRALRDFILAHHFDALVDYHSAALGIFPAGQPYDPASLRLASAVAAVTTYAFPPIDTGCEYTGNLVDWTALQGIAGIDLELATHTGTDFEMNLKVLSVLLRWKR
jgi:hypothetical protein